MVHNDGAIDSCLKLGYMVSVSAHLTQTKDILLCYEVVQTSNEIQLHEDGIFMLHRDIWELSVFVNEVV